jgi:predicted transcriptional regulator
MSKKVMIESMVEIVNAYVTSNQLPVEELPRLSKVVYDALSELERSTARDQGKPLTLAVDVRKSVNRNRIVCLEDGKRFKSLKGHLRAAHGLTPDEYRTKWGLEERYPMVAPAYSAQRSRLAIKLGLGRHGRRRPISLDIGKGQLTDAA